MKFYLWPSQWPYILLYLYECILYKIVEHYVFVCYEPILIKFNKIGFQKIMINIILDFSFLKEKLVNYLYFLTKILKVIEKYKYGAGAVAQW